MKAQMLTYLAWILRITFVAAVILSIGILTSKYLLARIDVSTQQASILSYRLLFENDLFYADKYTGIEYPVIYSYQQLSSVSREDVDRMLQSRLGSSSLAAGRIEIRRPATEVFGDGNSFVERPEFVRTFYYNRPVFERFSALSESLIFRGETAHLLKVYPVVFEESGQLSSANLTIEVFVQK